jgi:hypothetical protein
MDRDLATGFFNTLGRYGNRGAAAGGSENMPDLPQ